MKTNIEQSLYMEITCVKNNYVNYSLTLYQIGYLYFVKVSL